MQVVAGCRGRWGPAWLHLPPPQCTSRGGEIVSGIAQHANLEGNGELGAGTVVLHSGCKSSQQRAMAVDTALE